jgi:glutaredoxin
MITMYTKPGCSSCKLAKKYLLENRIVFFEIDLTQPENRSEFIAAYPEIRKVPAIFEDGKFIGGYNDLVERYSGQDSGSQLLEE